LVALHLRLGQRGHYAANRVMELVSSMFNRSPEWGWRGENPAAGIGAFKEQKRQSFLDGDELPSFFASLAQEKNVTVRDSILASLLTGARQSNVASMSWSEIRRGRSQRQERRSVRWWDCSSVGLVSNVHRQGDGPRLAEP
jgi:site-specific recombinase XerD